MAAEDVNVINLPGSPVPASVERVLPPIFAQGRVVIWGSDVNTTITPSVLTYTILEIVGEWAHLQPTFRPAASNQSFPAWFHLPSSGPWRA
jgi:hypothetical protein